MLQPLEGITLPPHPSQIVSTQEPFLSLHLSVRDAQGELKADFSSLQLLGPEVQVPEDQAELTPALAGFTGKPQNPRIPEVGKSLHGWMTL